MLVELLATGQLNLRPGNNAPLLASLAIISWLLGLRWYGISGMGLRGKRPLFASIGFATLGWVALLITRFVFITIDQNNMAPAGSGRLFAYILLFEAFAVQLWAFGLLFRAVAEWRNGLTAAFASGIAFGAVALTFFQEAAVDSSGLGFIFFLSWGLLYGFIRLRTGSILGSVLIQALQSFTIWIVLAPVSPLPPAEAATLPGFYGVTALLYGIFIWRLWPKTLEDHRI